ncbi:MAG: hypothetical protein WA324_26025 [Bryobacteraceae bacterium]
MHQKAYCGPDGLLFDEFLTLFSLPLPMASNPQRQLRGATVTCHTNGPYSSLVNYLVTREVLSVQLNPPFHPRLVLIPAKAIVQMRSTSSEDGLVEVHWENQIHKIFEADLTRLLIQRSNPK